MAKHALIFIHGMGDAGKNFDLQSSSQTVKDQVDREARAAYDELWKRLARQYQKQTGKSDFLDHYERIDINWHRGQLIKAEVTLFQKAFPHLPVRKIGWQDTFQSVRAGRHFMNFFLGDVLAYTSDQETKNLIRNDVWQEMKANANLLDGAARPYSLVAHSLGAAIAFDFLFYLFFRRMQGFTDDPHLADATNVTRLQESFRHFFTFGAPIGLFMLRSHDLWEQHPEFKDIYNPVRNGQWRNFYHPQDIIAYPLERLFKINSNNPDTLKDIEASDRPWDWIPVFGKLSAHNTYWKNDIVAKGIVETLLRYDVTSPSTKSDPSDSLAVQRG